MRNVYVDFGKDDLRNKYQPFKNSIYFDGVCYKGPTNIFANSRNSEKWGNYCEGFPNIRSGRPHGGIWDGFIKSGNKCRFLWSKDKDYGYKIFTNNYPKNIPPTEEEVRLVFTIQKLLFENGFSPEPYEVIRCEDKLREYFVIKMETIKGQPATTNMGGVKEWLEILKEFCIENKISSISGSDQDLLDINISKSGNINSDTGNIILSNVDEKIYLVDVDITFRIGLYL
jgi:hypothetical protein